MPWVAVFCVSNTPVQTFGSKSEGQPCINFPNFETLFTPENLTKIHSDNLANPNWEWQNRAQASFIMKNSSWVKTRDSKNNQWVIMDTIGIYEYNSKDLIGHGAFAVVYKGRVKMVSHKRVNIYFGYRNSCSEHWMFRVSEKVEQWTLLIPLATCKVSWQIHSHPKYDFGLDSFCLPDIYFAFSILLH